MKLKCQGPSSTEGQFYACNFFLLLKVCLYPQPEKLQFSWYLAPFQVLWGELEITKVIMARTVLVNGNNVSNISVNIVLRV